MHSWRVFLPPYPNQNLTEYRKERKNRPSGDQAQARNHLPQAHGLRPLFLSGRRVGLEMALTLTPRGACWRVRTVVCQIELGALKLKIHIYFNRLGCLEGEKKEG